MEIEAAATAKVAKATVFAPPSQYYLVLIAPLAYKPTTRPVLES